MLAAAAPAGAQEPRAIIYGGDREFPPYEYLDDNGAPQGFNIQLMRALAREAGLAVEIRLGLRDERMAEFDAGKTDVMFRSYSDERAAKYQLLDQTWTLSQVIMMRPGLPRYSRGTPLTSIRASMQLLIAEDMTPNEDADQLVRVALANADRLIRIVNDILDMSKIEAGEMMVALKRTPLGPILEDSVRTVDGFARNAGVAIVKPSGELPEVVADHDRSIQVLVNLLSNAVKHAPAGAQVEVSAEREGGMVAIAIRDHGPGIPAHKVDFLFEPFTQLDGSDTRRIPGTGLGLTIARALAQKQGGTIRVVSREDEGVTFTLTIPLA